MLFYELIALFLVAFYVVALTLEEPQPLRLLVRLALISGASWIVEESAILLYGFYRYDPCWSFFLGHVPVLVIVIWPLIIHSGWVLASQISWQGGGRVPEVATAIVLTDALIIEPVAVYAGLWSWTDPGIHGVPLIGLLGWAYFAFFCIFLLERANRREEKGYHDPLILLLPFIGTHILLLGTWWSVFRWINIPVGPRFWTGSAWVISLLIVLTILKNGTGKRVRKKTLLLRLPGAALFFIILVPKTDDSLWLTFYAIAFIPPYLMMMAQQYFTEPGWPDSDEMAGEGWP